MKTTRTALALSLLLVAGLGASACGNDESSSSSTTTTAKATSTTMKDNAGSGSMSGASGAMGALKPSGPGCAAVPAEGKGSFADMAKVPAATAASNNPALSTLVKAVTEASLVETLNGTGPFTIFAPVNDAFAKVPAADLNALLADKTKLTEVLTFHVVAGKKLSSKDLAAAGKATTVQGKDLTVSVSGSDVMVNGSAKVVCMDIPTANATIHLIDSVLLPGM